MIGWILPYVLLVFLAGTEPREVERQVHERINAERTKLKLKALKWDGDLAAVARTHSADMIERDYFAHVNPDGQSPSDRAVAAGYSCRVVRNGYVRSGFGENIYGTHSYRAVLHRPGPLPYYESKTAEELAIASVHGWMNSPGHRENIIRRGIRKTGIGVAIGADNRVIITQMFC